MFEISTLNFAKMGKIHAKTKNLSLGSIHQLFGFI